MEELRELEQSTELLARRYVRSRLGLDRQRFWPRSRLPSAPLPSIQSLARELCAHRGLDIKSRGVLPTGGTLVSVDELNFDRALVLLSLFSDARVYSDLRFQAASHHVQALSLRTVDKVANAPILESIVSDLTNGRVVILSASHCRAVRASRSLTSPILRMHVDLSTRSAVLVLAEV